MKPRSSADVELRRDKHTGRALRAAWVRALGCLLALASGLPCPALADSSTADALFREGRKASEAHDPTTAAARFAESYRLDPAPGTALNWALAEEQLGRLASALEHAREALAGLSKTDPRRPISQKLLDRLEKRTPRLLVRLAKGAPASTTVFRDDLELRGAALGVALPVDPGEHRLRVAADGFDDWTATITVREGEQAPVEIEAHVGAAKPTHDATETSPSEHSAGPVASAQPAAPAPVSPSRTPTIAIALVAVGGTALVAGGVFGGLVLKQKSLVDSHCENKQCDQTGLDAGTAGNRYALVSTIGVGVGVVGVGLGTYLWLRKPTNPERSGAALRLSPGHVGLHGTF